MEHQCDFKIESRFDSREPAQISGLISDLDRILRIIDLEITAQEEDARVFDASKSAYPVSARMLRARRDDRLAARATCQLGPANRILAFKPCTALSGGKPMIRRRSLMLSIFAAGCWIVLLAFVLNSVFAANKLHRQIRSKDRQSSENG
jgi:hypothetical protein